MIRIHLSHQVVVAGVPGFDHNEMAELAEAALQSELERIGHAINVNDQPARPLAQRYAKAKAKAGEPPVRNYHLTGDMLASREVVSSEDGIAVVGFTDGLQRAKAEHIETYEKMLGVSPNDREVLTEKAEEIFARNIKLAKAA